MATSALRDFLAENGLESLGVTFANEDLSLSDLRKLAGDEDETKYFDTMRALHVPLKSADKILTALLASDGEARASTVSASAVAESSDAIAQLASMARSQAAASTDMDSILAAALGKVASVNAPPPPPPAPVSSKPTAEREFVGLADSGLSYDSWKSKMKSTGDGKNDVAHKPSPVNAALLAYQSRGTTAMDRDEVATVAGLADKNASTQIVLSNGETKQKTKQFIPVMMSSR